MSQLLKLDQTPVGVINREEAIVYCAKNTELFLSLIEDYGLLTVYRNRTRHLYRIAAIDEALRLRELEKGGGE